MKMNKEIKDILYSNLMSKYLLYFDYKMKTEDFSQRFFDNLYLQDINIDNGKQLDDLRSLRSMYICKANLLNKYYNFLENVYVEFDTNHYQLNQKIKKEYGCYMNSYTLSGILPNCEYNEST